MPAYRLHPPHADRGPATCPHCQVTLTKSEAKGGKCLCCQKPFVDESATPSNQGPGPQECPRCEGPLQQKQVECVVCGRCGGLGPKWGDGADCSKCHEKYQLMELPASVCESCGWMSIDQRAVRRIRLRQYVALAILVPTIVLPVLEYWSPNISVWVFKKFGIRIPLVAWLALAGAGGAIAAALANPQRRLRKLGAFCGCLGGLGAFGLTWHYLRLMLWLHRESVNNYELTLVTLLGAMPAYLLYELLEGRQRKSENAKHQRTAR